MTEKLSIVLGPHGQVRDLRTGAVLAQPLPHDVPVADMPVLDSATAMQTIAPNL